MADCSHSRRTCEEGRRPVSERRTAPTVMQFVLGKRLRGLRDGAGLSAEEAAERIRVAQSTVTRLEQAKTALKYTTVKALLELYQGSASDTQEFLDLVDKANESGWWQGYHDVLPSWFGVHVSLESSASQIRSYEPQVVPGLLQTYAYCEAVMRLGFPRDSDDDIERRVTFRMERQGILTRRGSSLRLWAVVDETVFRRPAGDAQVMRDQITHLLHAADRPNVTLQIHPFSAGLHRGAFGPFTLFRFPIADFPDIACIDNLQGSAYKDDPGEVALYRQTFDHMITGALPRSRTGSFLSDLSKEQYG